MNYKSRAKKLRQQEAENFLEDLEEELDEGTEQGNGIHMREQVDDKFQEELETLVDTDRKQYQEWWESEEWWRSLVQNAPNIIIVVDRDGTVRYINHAVPGFTMEDVVGTIMYDYIPSSYRNLVKETIERVFDTGEPSGYETGGARPNSRDAWFDTRVGPITREGRVEAVVLFATDITERKHAEKALLEVEERLITIMESISDPIVIMNMEGGITQFNQAFTQTLGWGEEVKGKLPMEFVAERDIEGTAAGIMECYETGYVRNFEFAALTKDNREIPVHLGATLMKGADGDPEDLVAVLRDITELKESEKETIAARERLQRLISSSPTVVYSFKAYGDFETTFVSDNITSVLGYEPAQFLEERDFWASHLHPEDAPTLFASLPRVFEHGVDTVEYRFLHKDGTYRWCHDEPKLITDTEGHPVEIVGSMIDITERKQAEERQTELLNELQRVNQELTDFAYIVSHDLKAPLRGITSLADWLASDYRDSLDEMGREQLDLLMNRTRRMDNLIDGILQYSRLGRSKEEAEEVNLDTLVSQVIDAIDPPENIEIQVATELPTIVCEKIRIQQVFQNLLSNAVKYMDKPQGLIAISCADIDGYWKFGVTDNGPGIEEKYYDKIFQIFQTLKPRDETESTGIGLSIVKRIIEMHGGEVWVESKVGEGSTFSFSIPKETN